MNKPKRMYYTTEPAFSDYHFIMVTDKEVDAWGLDYMAESAAADFHSNSNWEGEPSIPFYLWNEEQELLGSFAVYIDYDPVFTAFTKVEAEK